MSGFIRILFIFLFLIIILPSWGWSAIYNCNGSQSDCQSKINSANDGDTVSITPGSYNWYSPVTVSKGITISGGGTYAIDANHMDVGSWPTSIAVSNNHAFEISVTTGTKVRITGLSFTGDSQLPGENPDNNGGIVVISNSTTTPWRVDNCKFVIRHNAVCTYGMWGLVDHIYSQDNYCYNNGEILVSDTRGDAYGWTAWQQAVGFGGPNFTFVEDSTFYRDDVSCPDPSTTPVTEAINGGKLVFRHNYVRLGFVSQHGTATAWPSRGALAFEVYNNEFYCRPGHRLSRAVMIWSGGALIHNNTFSNYTQMMQSLNRRLPAAQGGYDDSCYGEIPYYCCDGTHAWDGNTSPTGYPCMDQPGTGPTPGMSMSYPNIINPVAPTITKMRFWSNTFINVDNPVWDYSPGYTVLGRDYEYSTDATAALPGYTTYAYPHPLQFGGDTTPPVISNPLPVGAQTCSSNPRNITISVNTNENSTCKWSTTDQSFDLMPNTFSTTGALSHSSVISLACSASYIRYVRCMDQSGNKNLSSTTISFSIQAGGADVTPPVMSNPLPSGSLLCISNPQNITLLLTTSEDSTCKYSQTDQAYGSMEGTYSTTGGTSHSKTLSLACGTSHTYYSRCQDAIPNVNTSSVTTSFSILFPQSVIEAESGTIVSPMESIADNQAHGGYYIQEPDWNQTGTATFTVNVPATGTYRIIGRVYSIDNGKDSFWVKVDSETEFWWNTNPNNPAGYNSWIETPVTYTVGGVLPLIEYQIALTAGNHTIRFRAAEGYTRLDYFYLQEITIPPQPPATPSGFMILGSGAGLGAGGTGSMLLQ